MYHTHKTYIKPTMKMADLIIENPSLLLPLEHFGVEEAIHEKTVEQLCADANLNLSLFILVCNLYNGFNLETSEIIPEKLNVACVITYLKNSHNYYKTDKYPEIRQHILKLYEKQNSADIKRLEDFFNTYFEEVLEHLQYEDDVAFPYFTTLIKDNEDTELTAFSVEDYGAHHSDISEKLSDLKNLLLKHISFKGDGPLKRRILNSLFELERDLLIHSMIEDTLLMPLVSSLEKNANNG